MISSVVIVGAGHAGVQAAISLRQNGFEGAIKLVNNEPYLPYQRPPLSKAYLKGAGDPNTLAFRPAQFYADQRIELIGDRAIAINRAAHAVRLASGESLSYGHLVLATGATHRRLSIAGATAEIAYVSNLLEAEALRQRLQSVPRTLVIGAGFIGLEFAATARSKGAKVDVIELATRVMARAVTPEMSHYFQRKHEIAGITFHFGVQIEQIVQETDGFRARLSDGRDLAADLIVAGIGVQPNIDLAVDAGLSTASGIVVDANLLTDDPDISAIGDCTFFPSVHAHEGVRLESVQNATDQARCISARLTGKPHPYASLPWFWSDQGEEKLQIAGLAVGTDRTVLRGDPDGSSFSVFCYKAGKLIAVESVNRAADHMVGRKVLGAGKTIDPEVVADANVDLKRMIA